MGRPRFPPSWEKNVTFRTECYPRPKNEPFHLPSLGSLTSLVPLPPFPHSPSGTELSPPSLNTYTRVVLTWAWYRCARSPDRESDLPFLSTHASTQCARAGPRTPAVRTHVRCLFFLLCFPWEGRGSGLACEFVWLMACLDFGRTGTLTPPACIGDVGALVNDSFTSLPFSFDFLFVRSSELPRT